MAWAQLADLTGPAGPQGPTGAQGATGPAGTTTIRGATDYDDASAPTDRQAILWVASGSKFKPQTIQLADVANLVTDLAGKQPLDPDLTAIAALAPANDDVIQRKSGAWTNRTLAQLKTDLALQPLDADLTAIAGLSPTNNDVLQRISGAWTNRSLAQLKTAMNDTVIDPRCVVYASAGQTLTTTTHTALSWGGEIHDPLLWHSTVSNTSRVTPSVAGLMYCRGVAVFDSPDTVGDLAAHFRLNGATAVGAPYFGHSTSKTTAVGSAAFAEGLIRVNGTTDYIEMWAWHNRGSNKNTLSVLTGAITHSMMSVEYWAA